MMRRYDTRVRRECERAAPPCCERPLAPVAFQFPRSRCMPRTMCQIWFVVIVTFKRLLIATAAASFVGCTLLNHSAHTICFCFGVQSLRGRPSGLALSLRASQIIARASEIISLRLVGVLVSLPLPASNISPPRLRTVLTNRAMVARLSTDRSWKLQAKNNQWIASNLPEILLSFTSSSSTSPFLISSQRFGRTCDAMISRWRAGP